MRVIVQIFGILKESVSLGSIIYVFFIAEGSWVECEAEIYLKLEERAPASNWTI